MYYECQFCGEKDFDLEGLWFHYDANRCDAYREVGNKAVAKIRLKEQDVWPGEP